MKPFLHRLHNGWLKACSEINAYFLGSPSPPSRHPSRDHCSGFENVTKSGWNLRLTAFGEVNPQRFLEARDLDGTVLVLLASDLSELDEFEKGNNHHCIALLPGSLERIGPMVTYAISAIREPFILWVKNPSQMPAKADYEVIGSNAVQRAHEEAFEAMIQGLKRMHVMHGLMVVVSDHEEALGQKNSAFLRRIFS